MSTYCQDEVHASLTNQQFGHSDDSGSDFDDNDSSLPFPKPLDRNSFLTPDFDAATFLSGLVNRFQSLEDLQTELRQLSQSLNKELVDLVNDNYQDFLSLGGTLSGGEERIEEIRVGLLGFQRDIASVRDKVDARRNEIAELLDQKRHLSKEISVGRSLLEIAQNLDDLEEKFGIRQIKKKPQSLDPANNDGLKWSDGWRELEFDESDDDLENDQSQSAARLRRRAEQFRIVRHMIQKHQPPNQFLDSQRVRLRKIQEALLYDVDSAIKLETNIKMKQQILQLRASIDE